MLETGTVRAPSVVVRRGPPAGGVDAGRGRRVRGAAGPAAGPDRGARARRADGPARRARRRVPRRARDARRRPARQRELVRGGREPADPDQEPRDVAAPGAPLGRPAWPTRRPTPRPSCAPACCCTAPTATRARAWRPRRCAESASSGASPARPTPPRWPAPGPPTRRRSRPSLLVARARRRSPRSRRPRELPPEIVARTITLTERAAIIRDALRDAPTVVLQDLLQGVRDRVVVAVTFLAMLELMKRREIVVEQAEPWGRSSPVDDGRGTGCGGRRRAIDEPLDESLESFA